jgi:hypothetical protein
MKNDPSYNCSNCNFNCIRICDWNKHILTAKHLTGKNGNQKNSKQFICNLCEKKYTNASGLWKHKKKCIKPFEDIPSDKELIKLLIKQNEKLQKMHEESQKKQQESQNVMIELIKTTNIQNITNNMIKPTFNLNFFLNETCKDAMNIMDFIEQSKIEFKDFLQLESIGFVNGISNIIVKNLQALDIKKRPVHCTDTKRGTVYIKDNDEWEKEHETKPKLRQMIRKVADKNLKLIPEFKQKYPDCKHDTNLSDTYNKLIIETMGGHGDNDNEKEDKIIKLISKEIVIDK